MLEIIGLIILLIFFIIIVLIFNSRYTENQLLTGFWNADAEFCELADIDLLLMYIGTASLTSNKRSGYILMKNAEGLIINNPVEFCLSLGLSVKPGLCSCRSYNVSIDWLGEDTPEFFPSELSLYYYVEFGKLVFYDDDQIYAVVYKDNQMSALAADNTLLPTQQPTQSNDVGESI